MVYFDDASLEAVGHDEPRPKALTLGNPVWGLTGTYHPDGRVTFDGRPVKDWEFMATGTGVTGLTVSFPKEMLIQVNHSAAIDEQEKLRALGRLHLDLEGAPFAQSSSFRMEHDLRRSVITVRAETDDGPVRVEIRAHVPDDVIRLDIKDGRKTPGAMAIDLEEDAPSERSVMPDDLLFLRHENPPAGAALTDENRDWLAGRTFGLGLSAPQTGLQQQGHALSLPAATHHVLLMAGVSTRGGPEAFAQAVRARLDQARQLEEERFVSTHEAWWREFWARSSFEPQDKDGTMLRHKAAFDLYRYYLACCSGDLRETPVRFQIDLFRYHTRNFDWLTGLICAVEQYQSFYGAMRTGDWGSLRNLASFYRRNLPYYRHFARRIYGHAGARIPMWQSPLVLRPPDEPKPDAPPSGVPPQAYNGENPAGALCVLALLCDYVDLSGDGAFVDATLRPLATDLLEFLRLRYPQRENGRMVIAPCNAGETWQGVRDPSEMVGAFRMTLSRLIARAKAHRWGRDIIAHWEEMWAALPDLPRGRLEFRDPAVKPVILPGDQLVPAADMSGCEAYVLTWSNGQPYYHLNSQHTELFAIWPAKLVLRDQGLRDSAIRSYRERLWPHLRNGWNLDVVFAACLGLHDEVARWFGQHFDNTYVLPCGLARETAPENPQQPGLPECPSLQGMGTGIIPVLEMLLQDYPDELIVLPCWPEDVPVDFILYSPFAGKVEVHYVPKARLEVKTGREIRVTTTVSATAELKVGRLSAL